MLENILQGPTEMLNLLFAISPYLPLSLGSFLPFILLLLILSPFIFKKFESYIKPIPKLIKFLPIITGVFSFMIGFGMLVISILSIKVFAVAYVWILHMLYIFITSVVYSIFLVVKSYRESKIYNFTFRVIIAGFIISAAIMHMTLLSGYACDFKEKYLQDTFINEPLYIKACQQDDGAF